MDKAVTDYILWFHEKRLDKSLSYRGHRILKNPMDLWNYQEIIYDQKIKYVIETGSLHGGSATYFSDLLANMGNDGKVITIDINPIIKKDGAPFEIDPDGNIIAINASSSDPETLQTIKDIVAEDPGPILLILDSDHRMPHVYDELCLFVPWLTNKDYLIVEDTIINGHPIRPDFGPGPYEAVVKYLEDYPRSLVADTTREERFGATQATKGYYRLPYNA